MAQTLLAVWMACALAAGAGAAQRVTFSDIRRDGAYYGGRWGVTILLGKGDGTFGPPLNYPGEVTNAWAGNTIFVADLNGDGKPDIVTANYLTDKIGVLEGNGDGTFPPLHYFPTGARLLAVAFGDCNGDGKLDLVTANQGLGDLSVLMNTTP